MNRRNFIKTLGLTALSLRVLSISEVASATDDLVVISGPGKFVNHVHTLVIQGSLLDNPPAEGVRLKTTTTLLHKHVIFISQEQLIQIRSGQEVKVPNVDTQPAFIDHWFAIKLGAK